MEIQYSENFCIITPLAPKLDARETRRLADEIEAAGTDFSVGIDLSFVQDCTIDFLKTIMGSKAGLFNIPTDVFTLITLMNLDKFINLYVTKDDFLEDKRRMLNRRFRLV